MLILRKSIRFMIPIRCLHHGKWILFYAPHIFPSSILTRNWNCTGLARILDAANTFSSRRHPHGYAIAALPVATVSHKTATGKRKEKKKGNKKNPLVKVLTSTRGFSFIIFFHAIWSWIFSNHHCRRRSKIIYNRLMFRKCIRTSSYIWLSKYRFYTLRKSNLFLQRLP